MEFSAGPEGPIVPEPNETVSNEHVARTQAATDFFRANIDRAEHYIKRVEELGRSDEDLVITLIDVDDPTGGVLANALMPGQDWQQYRDAGEMPVACGLATKDGIAVFLEEAGYSIAAAELTNTDELRIVVLHAEVALVLDADFDVDTQSQ